MQISTLSSAWERPYENWLDLEYRDEFEHGMSLLQEIVRTNVQ